MPKPLKGGAQMKAGAHRVVFSGKLAPGISPQHARRALASRLGLSQKALDLLFSGRQVVLKKGLSLEQARTYARAFHKAGAVCRIVEDTSHLPKAVPHKPEAGGSAGAPCPKCGFAPVVSGECPRCGIVVSKFEKKPDTAPVAAAPATAPVFRGPAKSKKPVLILLLAAVAVFSGWRYLASRPIVHPPGVLIPDPPVQVNLQGGKMFNHQGVYITPLAEFSLKARVLSKKRYRFGDSADIVPWDLALGWGPMSDEAVLSNIKITQSGRFYYWSTSDPPIPTRSIERHSANMHLIPEKKYLKRKMDDVKVGSLIHLSGFLVKIYSKKGWRMKSSLTRDDTGAGACEVIFVKQFEIL